MEGVVDNSQRVFNAKALQHLAQLGIKCLRNCKAQFIETNSRIHVKKKKIEPCSSEFHLCLREKK